MAEIPWREGMPVRCPVCYGTDLAYAEDGWGTCRGCGARSAPTWTAPPEPGLPQRDATASGITGSARWPRALGVGAVAAVLGGILWGFAIWFRGYLLGFMTIPIALLVAYALERGAGVADRRLPAVAAGLTVAAVLLGELVFVLLLFSDGTLGPIALPQDYLANLADRATFPSYAFAGGGAVVGGMYLRDRWKAQERRARRAEARRPREGPRPG